MTWISIQERYPTKERYYRCLCLGFTKPIKCKFRKERNGPHEWAPDFFVYKKRVPFVVYWRET